MNIKRFFMVLAASTMISASLFSQTDNRNPIIVASFNNFEFSHKKADKSAGSVIGEIATAVLVGQSTKQMEGYEIAVRSAILKGMSDAHRLHVVEGTLTQEEAESPGAIYVDATLANMTTTTKNEEIPYEVKNKNGEKEKRYRTEVRYRAQLAVNLHVKDAMTDAVIASPSFSITESDMSWVNSAEKALENATARLAKRVTVFFDNMYPLTCEIIERGDIKNDRQKQVYIDLGAVHGLKTGQTLAIYTKKMIGGKEARQQVARLRVKTIEGDEVSLCKVLSGGAKALKSALDEGLELIVETYDN